MVKMEMIKNILNKINKFKEKKIIYPKKNKKNNRYKKNYFYNYNCKYNPLKIFVSKLYSEDMLINNKNISSLCEGISKIKLKD